MLNRYPLWKNALIIILIVLGVIYALPNLFPEDPAVQISAKNDQPVSASVTNQVTNALQANKLTYLSVNNEKDNLLVRFPDTDVQLKASDLIKATLGDDYIVALNLAPRTPHWLRALGANPMKLGLDLRGGIYLLLEVDTQAVVKARQEGDIRNMSDQLRSADIRYASITQQATPSGILLQFREQDNLDKATTYLTRNFPDYIFNKTSNLSLVGTLSQPALDKLNEYAIGQTITILNKRVDELGVAEAVVQQQGRNQISVELPGIQDTARAKDIIGKTATLKFQMLDTTHDIQSALAGNVPFGSKLYVCSNPNEYGCIDGKTLLLDQVILRGDSITYATASYSDNGRPSVQVRLGGGGESLFSQITSQNIGKPMAVIYVETQMQTKMVNGVPTQVPQQVEKVISIATIQSTLGNNFEIRGLDSEKYAQNLALLLRSGALVAPTHVIQERTVGPSLGKANIHMGVRSVIVGAALVILFMALYYGAFGVIADIALILDIVFIVAIMSILGATLTLPGIAGIVLTVGMAVDANVLINERIREELRNGMSPQASIHAGYSRAFATIVDANVTTLIVAMVLFALGSGTVKSFAITLTIGILTSMVTAIFFTRGIVNLVYGGRSVKKLSIGMKLRDTTPSKPQNTLNL